MHGHVVRAALTLLPPHPHPLLTSPACSSVESGERAYGHTEPPLGSSASREVCFLCGKKIQLARGVNARCYHCDTRGLLDWLFKSCRRRHTYTKKNPNILISCHGNSSNSCSSNKLIRVTETPQSHNIVSRTEHIHYCY